MKHFLTSLTAGIISLCATAQTLPADSVKVKQLDEIVIEAPRVIRKADMDVYHPSKSAVDYSKNGMQLLDNLMIPSVSVNDALGTVTAAGETVQLRINGRESTVEQVKALLPQTIRRVEWLDNPGLRYGGTNYVLNFIVVNPTSGGSLMAAARPALNEAWGVYNANVKINHGLSQWEAGSFFKLTNKIKTHRDYTETFTYPDGTSLTRDETSRGGTMDNTFGGAWLSYSYVKPEKTVFMADLKAFDQLTDRHLYRGLLSLSDGSDDILLTDSHGDKGPKTGLSLYWQQTLPRKQTIIVNFSSNLYFGHSFSDYIERLPGDSENLTDIHTDIKDRNQTYVAEADYIKNWKNGRLTTGVSYTANRNRSEYLSLGGDVFHQRQDRVYFFAEYFHRFGKWTASAGMGAQYTDFLFRESDRGSRSWSPRPQATVSYAPNQKHSFRLNFTSWQTAPSLAETNVVPQQLDGFQWRVGNQNLKTSNSYMLIFSYNFTLPRVNGTFGIRAFTSPNAITPFMAWEGDRLITSYENSDGLRNLSFFISPQIEIIPKWLMASGYLQFRMDRMQGTGYKHHHNGWSGNAQLRLTHWGFNLSAMYLYSQKDLWGEQIRWGENVSMVELSYNWKSWQFGTGVIMPFGRYDQGSRSLCRWNRNEKHMRLDMRIPYLSVTYNLQWGHQRQQTRKLIDVNADVEQSKAGGR